MKNVLKIAKILSLMITIGLAGSITLQAQDNVWGSGAGENKYFHWCTAHPLIHAQEAPWEDACRNYRWFDGVAQPGTMAECESGSWSEGWRVKMKCDQNGCAMSGRFQCYKAGTPTLPGYTIPQDWTSSCGQLNGQIPRVEMGKGRVECWYSDPTGATTRGMVMQCDPWGGGNVIKSNYVVQ